MLARDAANPDWAGPNSAGDEIPTTAAPSGSGLARRQQERQEAIREAKGDGRYAAWCGGYDLGCFWSCVDTSVGVGLERDPEAMHRILPLRIPGGAGAGAGVGVVGAAAGEAGRAGAAAAAAGNGEGEDEDGVDAIEAPRDAAAAARAAADAADLEAQ